MENIQIISNQEKEYDHRLEMLWNEYGFPGQPPVMGSKAEKRLLDYCTSYSRFLTSNHISKDIKSSDTERRTLHNQIAIMVVGKQRSGMESSLAEHIADFAFEYAKGFKLSEFEKYSNQNGGVN